MTPIIKVDDMAFPILQVPDLDKQETFLLDFGMKRAHRTKDTLYMRGAGAQPYVHVSTLGPKKVLSMNNINLVLIKEKSFQIKVVITVMYY